MSASEAPLLDVRGLTGGYGNKTVVRDVSFRVQPNRVLALFGHNGCGKTTTLKGVLGLLEKATGEVWLDGERIDRQSATVRLGKGLRLLPDSRGVFGPLTVAENLEVVADRNCQGTNVRIAVKDVLELFPVLADRMSATAGSLSGGQQKMLALGLAILGSPRCILLDEPSIGLQPNLVERLFAQVREICQSTGVGVVLVEQNVAAAMKVADHVTILNNGEVVFDGTPEDARGSNFWHYF